MKQQFESCSKAVSSPELYSMPHTLTSQNES
jgi:hypothetical protein